MKRLVFVFILLEIFSIKCIGQEDPIENRNAEPVVFPGQKKWGHPTRIQFYDTVSGKLLRDYNLEVNNPYKLPYKLISISRDTTIWEYEIEDGSPVDTNYLFSSDYPICNYPDRVPKFIQVEASLVGLQGDFVVVAYQMISKDKYNQGIGGRTTVFILNKSGEELYRLNHLPYDANGVAISSTGKFLMTSFYGPIGCSNYVAIRQGIAIYDLENGRKEYENKTIYGVFPMQLHNDMIGIRVELNGGASKYMFFCPADRIVYEKEFSRSEEWCIKKFTSEEFKIQCKENDKVESIKFTTLPSNKF